jgi:parvulin-like peptidyl-prolyl isomerase
MIKKVLLLFATVVWLNGSLINAIAVVVNDTAITLYDIDEVMVKQNLSHNQAVGKLIDDVLYENEIEKFGIHLDDDELKSYIEQLALSNNMSVKKFKSELVKQGQNYDIFLESIKKRILNQKLLGKIAAGKLKIASDEDMKLFYENNIGDFRIDQSSIQVVPFEKVKGKIFNIIMTQREQKYLKEYFEALKITADIKVIR